MENTLISGSLKTDEFLQCTSSFNPLNHAVLVAVYKWDSQVEGGPRETPTSLSTEVEPWEVNDFCSREEPGPFSSCVESGI